MFSNKWISRTLGNTSPNEEGIGPVSSFDAKLSNCTSAIVQLKLGIRPLKELLLKRTSANVFDA
jgi:hypothetical protein